MQHATGLQQPAGTYEPTPSGDAELRRGVTDLSAIQLELLVRLDGRAPLGEIRAAMLRIGDAEFFDAVHSLERGGLVRRKEIDALDAQMQRQLQVMGMSNSNAQGAVRAGTFAVGLARRRPIRLSPPRQLTAVVVEDEPTLAYFVECFLSLEGFDVRVATNREEVVAAMRRGVPDVVLLDGSLPDVDGFHVLRSMRQNPQLRHVPALMMTARATRESVIEALTSGADGYLTKPVDAEALTTAVRAVTGLPDSDANRANSADPWLNRDALAKRDQALI